MSKNVFDQIADGMRELLADPPMALIVFFRADGFYPTQYPATYSDWQAEADRNPGTKRIEDAHGNVLWEAPETAAPDPQMRAAS